MEPAAQDTRDRGRGAHAAGFLVLGGVAVDPVVGGFDRGLDLFRKGLGFGCPVGRPGGAQRFENRIRSERAREFARRGAPHPVGDEEERPLGA